MRLHLYQAAAAFAARATPFLVRHEAHNNLLLGLCATLIEGSAPVEQAPYLTTVEADGEVVAACVMTPPNRPVLSVASLPDAVAVIADDVYERYPACPGVLGPAAESRAFAERWERRSGRPCRRGVAQRIYQLEAVIPVAGVSGDLRRATEADRPLLVEWATAFNAEAHGDTDLDRAARAATRMVDVRLTSPSSAFYFWHDGQPVSLAGYSGPTPHGIRVGPVYTPPGARGRGYASAGVAAVSRLLLDEGRRSCFLFTDLGNPTANRIYQAIGYQPVCDVDEYAFT